MNYYDQNRNIKGTGGGVYTARVIITQEAWNKADQDAQKQSMNILANEPIPLLTSSGKGPGFKWEGNGWSIHTQTNKSLYDTTNLEKAPRNFLFDTYKKRPH